MFKLVVISALVAVALAKPHTLVGSLVSEKTIESHGNTVVHGTAPVLSYAAVHPVHSVHAVQPQAHLISEKTIESHGNTVVHGSAPVLSYAAVPAISYAAVPAVYAHQPAALISEKSISSYGHSVVHHAAPVVHAPAVAYSAIAYGHPAVSVW